MTEPAISPPDERHCGECCTGHRHGDGHCEGEYFTDRASPVPTCVECPGFNDDPILHSKTCGRHIREARDERRARERGVD